MKELLCISHLPQNVSNLSRISKYIALPPLPVVSSSSIPQDDPDQKSALQRLRRRIIQRRYREKQVQRLQGEVRFLTMQYKDMLHTAPTLKTPWKVVAEYYRLFRYGLSTFKLSGETSVLSRQLTFLHATMAADVLVRTGFGVDALLESWRLLTIRYNDVEIRLACLERGEGDSFTATIKCFFTVTENTLRFEFPHLVSHYTHDGKLSRLAAKLLGQRIELPGTVRFVWDDESTRITCALFRPDILTPLLKLLDNLEEVMLALGGGVTAGSKSSRGLFKGGI